MEVVRGKITLVPEGGLGNRMRTIVAGIRLAQAVNAHLEIVWFQDWGLGCRYDVLFKPLALHYVTIREATRADLLLRDRPRRRNLWLPRIFERLQYDVCIEGAEFHTPADEYIARCKGKNVWISSCGYFMSKITLPDYFNLFSPQDDIRKRIDQTAAAFGKRTVGVHLRRTDNAQSVNESPTALFIERMKAEPADTIFYLASDSEEDKQLMKDVFGKRLITSDRQAERGTTEGMKDAVTEMFLLSKTQHILGSYYSSFSLIASYISGKKLEIVKRQQQ